MKRTKTSKNWMHEHVDDFYVNEAQRLGYRSRAAFKLLQANEKYKFLKQGSRIVDLGSAPGSWSEVLSKLIGERSKIIAVDILVMQNIKNVEFIQGDFREEAVLLKLERKLENEQLDLVISDMAPNISGIKVKDQLEIIYLNELALDFSLKWLKPNGHFLVKSFVGTDFEKFLGQVKRSYKKVTTFKPKASRDRSSEIFIYARDLLAN
ncbi:MAG: RlmE family RNA methyltransferase [Proteobacteria bacterium]|nr:RlmE family RNA methyltransferase [Pseudomonadota bacterium]